MLCLIASKSTRENYGGSVSVEKVDREQRGSKNYNRNTSRGYRGLSGDRGRLRRRWHMAYTHNTIEPFLLHYVCCHWSIITSCWTQWNLLILVWWYFVLSLTSNIIHLYMMKFLLFKGCSRVIPLVTIYFVWFKLESWYVCIVVIWVTIHAITLCQVCLTFQTWWWRL